MSEGEKVFEGFHLEPQNGGWLIRSYDGPLDDLRIPEQVEGIDVTMIAANAFEDNRTLKRVVIPDTVTFIGNYAFWNCTSLEHVTVGRGITSLNMATFMGCTALVQADLPDTLTLLGDGIFKNCTALPAQVIPETVTMLGDSCFHTCTSLTSIVLPAAIKTVARNCFRGCKTLSTVIMHGGVEYVGPRAFQECPSLESITFADSDINTSMNAMRNYSLMCFVADEAIARGMVSFDDAKKLLTSKSERERILAARALAAHPERSSEITMKQTLCCTLAAAGRTEELRCFEGQPGFGSKFALMKCIDAANANGHTETAAYLLDRVARLDGPVPERRSTGLEL